MPKISSSRSETAHRRELFVAAYATTGNATAAAIAAGFSESNAATQGDRLMHEAETGLRARKAREQHVHATQDAFRRQQQALRDAADGAIKALIEIAEMPPRAGAQARVLAAVAILDRAGHKPVERIEQQIAWADVSRELAGVDVRAVLEGALAEISQRPDALPGPQG